MPSRSSFHRKTLPTSRLTLCRHWLSVSLVTGVSLVGGSTEWFSGVSRAADRELAIETATVWDGKAFDPQQHGPRIRSQWQTGVTVPGEAESVETPTQLLQRAAEDPDSPHYRAAARQDSTAAAAADTIQRGSEPTNERAVVENASVTDGDTPSTGAGESHDAKTDKTCASCVPNYPVGQVPFDPSAFSPDPCYEDAYCGEHEQWVYSGKSPYATERPWIELGRGMYLPGRLPCSQTRFGDHNLTSQHFLLYGDYRTAVAYIDSAGDQRGVWASRLNLDWDWKLTDTERIHGFWGPLDRGLSFTRLEARDGDVDFIDEFDPNWDTIFFEGDVGSILGGLGGYDSRFDMPFAAGLLPLLFQNGIWMEDAMVGAAVTFPARHNVRWDWSNYDVTFFTGFDNLNSPAFGNDDGAANVYGVTSFIEANGGYWELGYAYLDDTVGLQRSYHNMTASFTRRYFQRVSNSLRVIVNAGQDPLVGPRTADGCLVVWENSLVSSRPNTLVPYANFFAGFGRPQSVARAAVAGGILRNTGIVFETDGLTGFPLLDDTGSNSYGGAVGVNWMGDAFDYQVILELGTVQTFSQQAGRRAVDDQYGLGARYQLPLNQAWILRLDAIYGIFENDDNISGLRAEMRYKF